jgi:hypothetical protein
MTQTAALEIVWRNPDAPQRQQRWEQINDDLEVARYLVQELLCSPFGAFWATTSRLEVVTGDRAA